LQQLMTNRSKPLETYGQAQGFAYTCEGLAPPTVPAAQ
jgi:hypothetical protein